uniref:hypothetical protein n=1 Tax=Parablautia muri TaxID=2320879 RepID=UPI0024126E85
DRKMSRFVTADKIESVTAHEVINRRETWRISYNMCRSLQTRPPKRSQGTPTAGKAILPLHRGSINTRLMNSF